MRSILLASSTIVLVLGSHLAAQEKKDLTIEVGGTKIKVPAPSEMVASKSKLKTMARYMAANTPTNKLHEIFAAKDATEKSFMEKGLKRNADVQTVNSLNNKMTGEIFSGVKKLLTNQFDQMIKDVTKKLSEDNIKIDALDKVGTGPFVDKDDCYSYLFFSSVKAGDKTIQRVSAASICFVKDNMVMLNVHSNLDSEKDAEWVKKTAKKWIEATLKANGDN